MTGEKKKDRDLIYEREAITRAQRSWEGRKRFSCPAFERNEKSDGSFIERIVRIKTSESIKVEGI